MGFLPEFKTLTPPKLLGLKYPSASHFLSSSKKLLICQIFFTIFVWKADELNQFDVDLDLKAPVVGSQLSKQDFRLKF